MILSEVSMDFDGLNRRIIEIQEKLFDAEMQVTRVALELLNSCGGKISLNIEIPYLTAAAGYRTFASEEFFFDVDNNQLVLSESSGIIAAWDQIDIQSKELIVNEVYAKLTSDRIYSRLSAKDEIH